MKSENLKGRIVFYFKTINQFCMCLHKKNIVKNIEQVFSPDDIEASEWTRSVLFSFLRMAFEIIITKFKLGFIVYSKQQNKFCPE